MQIARISKHCKQLLQQHKKNFSSSQLLDKWVKTSSVDPLEGHEILFKTDQKPQYNISETSQGVKVITEQSQFPSMMDLGVLVNTGSRNETAKHSGALFLLQFLHMTEGEDPHTFINNFNKIKFSGAQVQMSYDHESTYWKNSFLHEDFDAMLDFQLRTSIGEKKYVIQDASLLAENQGFQSIDDLILPTAFGNQNCGMPIRGVNDKMTQDEFLEFQRQFITPKRTLISAANIQNHEEFVAKVEAKLQEFPEFLSRREHETSPNVYRGGENRVESDESEYSFAICFESVNWTHQDMTAFQIVNTIMGNSSSFSTGGPGKGMHSRTSKNLLNRLFYIESASTINHHFSDAGVFGIKVSGANPQRKQLINAAIDELKKLTDPISEVELLRGKNMLYSLINLSLERQVDRLEEISKNIFSFQKLKLYEYQEDIYKVTSEQINQLIAKLLKSKPTIVITGQNTKDSYSYDQILNLLNQ